MENTSIIPQISQNILINFVPESEKQKVEEELENCRKKLKDAEIRKDILKGELDRTSLSIKTYIDAEKILREENEKLNQKIIHLENENKELKIEISELKIRISNLENENIELKTFLTNYKQKEIENQKILNISECVYNYKKKLWTLIFQKEITKKQRQFGKDNLRDILSGLYDNKLTQQEFKIKNKIADYIKSKYDIEYFFNSLNMINIERNTISHPEINYENINTLRNHFLNHCNNIWENDEEMNKEFTEDIFSILICSSTDFI